MGGNEITSQVAKSFSMNFEEAEIAKKKFGLKDVLRERSAFNGSGQDIKEILIPLVDVFLREISVIIHNFEQTEGKIIQKVILAGGTALLPQFKEYCRDGLKKETEVANPFSDILCPPILENILKEMGPSYAVAVGMAERGLE